MNTVTASTATRRGRALCFPADLVGMTVAMMLGMAAYAGLLAGVLASAGNTLEDSRLGQPELFGHGFDPRTLHFGHCANLVHDEPVGRKDLGSR
jgi:hypothetical protein